MAYFVVEFEILLKKVCPWGHLSPIGWRKMTLNIIINNYSYHPNIFLRGWGLKSRNLLVRPSVCAKVVSGPYLFCEETLEVLNKINIANDMRVCFDLNPRLFRQDQCQWQVTCKICVWSIFFTEKYQKFLLHLKLLMTWGCVIILTEGQLVKVFGRKVQNSCLVQTFLNGETIKVSISWPDHEGLSWHWPKVM